MIALLLPHTGAHAAQHAPLLACLPPFFRRAVAAVRRKPAVPATFPPAGAASALLADAEPVLRDRWVHDVRAETDARQRAARHADAMHAGYASAVDRLRQEAGLPTVKQMRKLRAGSPPWLFPPLEEPLWEEPEPRGPVHDTRMDVYAPHYAPDVPAPKPVSEPWASLYQAADLMDGAGRQPEYGQECTANVLAAEQEGRQVA